MQETCPHDPHEAPPAGGGYGKATPEEKERKKRWGARRSHLRKARELLAAQGKLGDRTPMVLPARKIANPGVCWQGKVKKRQQEACRKEDDGEGDESDDSAEKGDKENFPVPRQEAKKKKNEGVRVKLRQEKDPRSGPGVSVKSGGSLWQARRTKSRKRSAEDSQSLEKYPDRPQLPGAATAAVSSSSSKESGKGERKGEERTTGSLRETKVKGRGSKKRPRRVNQPEAGSSGQAEQKKRSECPGTGSAHTTAKKKQTKGAQACSAGKKCGRERAKGKSASGSIPSHRKAKGRKR